MIKQGTRKTSSIGEKSILRIFRHWPSDDVAKKPFILGNSKLPVERTREPYRSGTWCDKLKQRESCPNFCHSGTCSPGQLHYRSHFHIPTYPPKLTLVYLLRIELISIGRTILNICFICYSLSRQESTFFFFPNITALCHNCRLIIKTCPLFCSINENSSFHSPWRPVGLPVATLRPHVSNLNSIFLKINHKIPQSRNQQMNTFRTSSI